MRLLRDQWLATPRGEFAGRYVQHLLWSLLSGWQRRGRSMLVLNAGSGPFAHALWEIGFDVTAQDEAPVFLDAAQSRLGTRAEYLLAMPDHLPCDDLEYDYSVAVCAPEVWGDVQQALHELHRVSAVGVILIFTNTLSVNRAHCMTTHCFAGHAPFFRKKNPKEVETPAIQNTEQTAACTCSAPVTGRQGEAFSVAHELALRYPAFSPLKMRKMVAAAFPGCRRTWRSCLMGPAGLWRDLPLMGWRDSIPSLPVPCGAVCGLRIDMQPAYSGTPLLLRTSEAAKSGIVG